MVVAVTWVTFGVDYLVRLALSPARWDFVRHNVFDLLVIALPVVRPLRLLRLVALLSVLNRTGAHTLRGRVTMKHGSPSPHIDASSSRSRMRVQPSVASTAS